MHVETMNLQSFFKIPLNFMKNEIGSCLNHCYVSFALKDTQTCQCMLAQQFMGLLFRHQHRSPETLLTGYKGHPDLVKPGEAAIRLPVIQQSHVDELQGKADKKLSTEKKGRQEGQVQAGNSTAWESRVHRSKRHKALMLSSSQRLFVLCLVSQFVGNREPTDQYSDRRRLQGKLDPGDTLADILEECTNNLLNQQGS